MQREYEISFESPNMPSQYDIIIHNKLINQRMQPMLK